MAPMGRRRVMIVGRNRSNRAGGGGAGGPLVQPGSISSRLATFTRAQVSAFATATNAAGEFLTYGADAVRFNGAAQRLILEGQRTNNVSNSLAEGFSAGTPGTMPTGWIQPVTQGGLTRVLSAVSAGGLSGLGINFSGTASNTTISQTEPSVRASAPAATPSQTRTVSALLWLAGGSITNITSVTLGGLFLTAAGGSISGNSFNGPDIKASLTAAPQLFTFTCTSTADVTVARFNPRISIFVTNGAASDAVIGVAYLGEEIAPFASTPIFPPVGAPGATTRGLDNLTWPFAALFPGGVGTVLASFMLPQNATGADQVLFDIDDGTASNRIRLRNVAGGATIVAGRTIAGANTDATTIGSHTAGTLFRVGLTFDGSTITANFNGGTNQTVAGVPSGLAFFRLGNDSAGTAALFGEPAYVEALPSVISGANLPAAVAAIP